jgi:hypothetical protein
MLLGPAGIPLGLYFLYLAKVERSNAKSAERAEKVTGEITHLWKEPKEAPERRYRVGYAAPKAQPAFICVSAARFKKLSLGDKVEVLVVDGKSFLDL